MSKIIRQLKFKRGYITITVLILMMVLVAASYLYADALFSELTIARNNKGTAAAFSLAEAGVQEAIYLIQYDAEVRNTFLNTVDGVKYFDHPAPALIAKGSYSVTIQNTAKAAAIVTSIGSYQIGTLRTARREIKVGIAQANTPPPYPYDGGIYTTGSGAGSSIADVDFWYAPVKIFGGGVLSNRDINLKFSSDVDVEKTVEAGNQVDLKSGSTLDCNCLLIDDGDPETTQCADNPGCTPLEGAPPKTIPSISFDAYKTLAQIQGQYYASQSDFKNLIPNFGSGTFNGVVFIDGPLDIDWGRTITMNGVIAASGSIRISLGQLLTNTPSGGGASGVLSMRDVEIGTLGNFSGSGLVYAGDRFRVDSSIPYPLNLTGGVISRRTWISGYRITNIYFDADIINTALGNPLETPVIEINHWEEEY
ncbi:MAG: hypothetical protein AAB785_00585 [Patescibacteria group bacterium]